MLLMPLSFLCLTARGTIDWDEMLSCHKDTAKAKKCFQQQWTLGALSCVITATFSSIRVSLEFRPNFEIEKEKLSPKSSEENPDLVFRTFPDSREFCCVQNCIYICTLNPSRRHLNHNKAGKLKVDILLQRNYSVKWVKTIAIR